MRIFLCLLLIFSLSGCGNSSTSPSLPSTSDSTSQIIPVETYNSNDFTLSTTGVIYSSSEGYLLPLSYLPHTMYDTELTYIYTADGVKSKLQGYGYVKEGELELVIPESNISDLEIDLEFRVYTSSMGDGYHIIHQPLSFSF